MAVQDGDMFIVNRGGIDHKVSASDLDDKLQNDDQVLINRGGTDYKVSGADLREYLGIAKMPWEGHDGGIFHVIITDPDSINIRNDDEPWFSRKIYNLATLAEVSSIDAPGEYIMLTTDKCERAFKNSGGNWNFGELTDTSRVTGMQEMFLDCEKFNSDISNWDTGKTSNMTRMFKNAYKFNRDLSQWCVNHPGMQYDRFDLFADAWADKNKPVWGTCPRGENKP